MAIERVKVLVVGTRPLLMNRMTPEELEALDDKTKKKGKAAAKAPAQERAAAKVYAARHSTGEERPVMPVENLMACLIEAGKYVRLDGKRQVSTGRATVLPGVLTITTPVLWLLKPNGGEASAWGIAEWRYELRQGRNPNGGEAVAIVRPRFETWAFDLEIEVDTDTMPLDAYRTLFDLAGKRIGLCDFRPQCKGIFGQFRIDRWDVQA
jgi:hypothetical protein